MKTTINGKEASISWKHIQFNPDGGHLVSREVLQFLKKFYGQFTQLPILFSSRRGISFCFLNPKYGDVGFPVRYDMIGIAECSKKDQFNKKIGRKASLSDMIQHTTPRYYLNAKKQIWADYFKSIQVKEEPLKNYIDEFIAYNCEDITDMEREELLKQYYNYFKNIKGKQGVVI